MKRWNLWIFGVLALAGTAGGVLYAVGVAPGAKTKFEVAVLVFTAAAAVTGFLGLIVSWLGYRLEAGRVPKPDLAIVSDGKLVRRWELDIELLDPEPDVSTEVQKEHDRLVAVIESLQQPAKSPPTMLAAAVLGTAWTGGRVSDEAIPALRPPVRGLRPREAAVQGRGNPDRQRRRVRLAVPHHVLDLGIGHVYIKPATPRLNGKVERSHRIDQEESYRMLEGVVIDDTGLFNDRLQEWETFYNFNRPHGGLGGQTPYERLREKTRAPA